jgi:hypothetical protein
MNSREKGKRGERQWRDELRANGYAARRGQQFAGSPDSPDVVCDQLRWIHFEVKAVERLNIEDAMEQARRDARQKTPIVAHKRSFRTWLVTMDAETFFRILRGDFAEAAADGQSLRTSQPTSEEANGLPGPRAKGTDPVGVSCAPVPAARTQPQKQLNTFDAAENGREETKQQQNEKEKQ